jgi:hypothetical protein
VRYVLSSYLLGWLFYFLGIVIQGVLGSVLRISVRPEDGGGRGSRNWRTGNLRKLGSCEYQRSTRSGSLILLRMEAKVESP